MDRTRSDSPRDQIPRGTLDMLILETLRRTPLHGYAIAKRIQQDSDDALQVEEGSLYPALQRMLRKGWVSAHWVAAGPKRRARVYELTATGRKRLVAERSQFRRVVSGILRVIEPA